MAELQISETETPLHKLETVYRRLTERLTTRARARFGAATFMPAALAATRRAGPNSADDRVAGLRW